MQVTTLTGGNSFLLQQSLQNLVSSFVKLYGEIGVERFDGEEASFDQMREALQSLPFLVSKKLIVLKNPGANKQFLDSFEALLTGMPDSSEVVIIEPKLDKRTQYYKYLQKHTDFQKYAELDEAALVRWIQEQAQKNGATINATAARYLVERVGINQRLLSNELKKLFDYNPHVTQETIELLVELTPQSSIFDLLEAAFAGRLERAMALYDEQRKGGVEPGQLIAMIAWQLHVVAIIKTAGGRDPVTIAQEAKINPYVVRKSGNIAKRLELEQLKNLVHEIVILDAQLKSQSIDADEALRNLLVRLAHL